LRASLRRRSWSTRRGACNGSGSGRQRECEPIFLTAYFQGSTFALLKSLLNHTGADSEGHNEG
jgi:hypothetical protein